MDRLSLPTLWRPLALAAALLTFSWTARAAVISGSYTGPITTDISYNLTTLGTTDWAVWNNRSTAIGASGAPNNSMLGATVISDISTVGGGTLRGTSAGPFTTYNFSFTNGSPTPTSPLNDATGPFNTLLNNPTAGVTLTYTLPAAATYNVYVWVTGYGVTGNFNANLPGATPYSNSSFTADTSTRPGALYTLTVTPDTAADQLVITYYGTPNTASNGNVSISAAAISVIPEPGVTALLAGVMLPALALRHRRTSQP